MEDLENGWQGRRTSTTRVAFHEDGSTVVYQDGSLIAQAAGITPAVIAFLFGDELKSKKGNRCRSSSSVPGLAAAGGHGGGA